MTEPLFRDDAYARDATATVVAHMAEGGIVLDHGAFYPTGGGQPGDAGALRWGGGRIDIATTIRSAPADIVLVPAEPPRFPPSALK